MKRAERLKVNVTAAIPRARFTTVAQEMPGVRLRLLSAALSSFMMPPGILTCLCLPLQGFLVGGVCGVSEEDTESFLGSSKDEK
jgi:hypothetical protein